MSNVVLMPNITSRLNRRNHEIVTTMSDLLRQLEGRLIQISTFIDSCSDGETKRTLLAQSATVSGLIAQAREKTAWLASKGLAS